MNESLALSRFERWNLEVCGKWWCSVDTVGVFWVSLLSLSTCVLAKAFEWCVNGLCQRRSHRRSDLTSTKTSGLEATRYMTRMARSPRIVQPDGITLITQ